MPRIPIKLGNRRIALLCMDYTVPSLFYFNCLQFDYIQYFCSVKYFLTSCPTLFFLGEVSGQFLLSVVLFFLFLI